MKEKGQGENTVEVNADKHQHTQRRHKVCVLCDRTESVMALTGQQGQLLLMADGSVNARPRGQCETEMS